MEEIWKPVTGFEGLYEVSSLGNIRSLDRVVPVKASARLGAISHTRRGMPIKPHASKRHKYLSVGLHKLGKTRLIRVHRLVAEAFLGPAPEDRPYINHKDLDRVNNRLDNLEYCSPLENISHARENGRLHKWTRDDGPMRDTVAEVFRLIAEGELSCRQIDERLGLRRGLAAEIRRGETWNAPSGCKTRPKPAKSRSAADTPGRRRKLSLSEAEELVTLWRSGKYTQKQLGERFGVTQSNVSYMVSGKSWSGLT